MSKSRAVKPWNAAVLAFLSFRSGVELTRGHSAWGLILGGGALIGVWLVWDALREDDR